MWKRSDRMKLRCSLCEEYKDSSHFYTNKTKRGFDYRCKPCARKGRNKNYNPQTSRKKNIKDRYSEYGITEEDYQIMRVNQEFCCYICGRHESEIAKKTLMIDHNHSSGRIRGLLCSNCNVTLGLVGENKNTLLSMIQYLEEDE